ncbi:MAG: DUF5666 domain-containing protein [Thermoleophilia bacterium]|nr:DUF5666 domain-containing protein [Thermoleophilia bacterium]
MKKWIVALLAAVIVVVGVGAFFAGRASVSQVASTGTNLGLARGQLPSNQGGTLPGQLGGVNGSPNGPRGSLVSGTILSVDDTGITVKTADGGSKIVLVTSSTTLVKTEEATRDDLVAGQEVTIVGEANEDGSLTASRIQLGTALDFRNRQPNTTGG